MTDLPPERDARAGEEPRAEGPDAEAADPGEPADQQWWSDPSLPWGHKPTKSDLRCWAWLAVCAIYGLVMLPLRPWLLTVPYVSALLNGSRVAIGAVGALASTRPDPVAMWLPTLLVAAASMIKWDWLFWWAGKLWGQNIIDLWAGRGPRARRWAAWLERFASRHPVVSMTLTYLPIPLVQVVYAVLGAAGYPIRRFLLVDYVLALVVASLYFGLGFWIGKPAVDALALYSQYALYVSLVVLVVVIVTSIMRGRKGGDPKVAAPRG